ncbi:(Fe-S)-binding protein [Chloroflexota bacterium]
MQHKIDSNSLFAQIGPQAEPMTSAIEACVHCGFCLPVCPTYKVLKQEVDSPRGRILLMKSVLEGDISIQDVVPYIDHCLGCLSCVSICPSGVKYEELISPFKAYARNKVRHSVVSKIQQGMVKKTFPYPDRFRFVVKAGKLVKPLRKVFPPKIRGMLSLLPDRLPNSVPLPALYPAEGKRRARVALLTGCVQQVLMPGINWATLRVLARNGVEVIIPEDQVCCGAIFQHTGDIQEAHRLARKNLRAFSIDVDAVLTNAAGCGSGMKEYPFLFKGMAEEEVSTDFANKVQDVSEFLIKLGMKETQGFPLNLKVVYHDACHLAHAQGITQSPRQLLTSIPNLSLLESQEREICCGSAGTYNIDQPDIAQELGARKIDHLVKTGAEMVATGNVGCMVQIESNLKANRIPMLVYHTFEILDLAYSYSK